MKPKINLLLGPPGTGKTTYLIDKINVINKTIDMDKIAFISFTKSAIEEAKKRINQKDLEYFRTIHSLSFSLLGLKSTKILTDELIEKFEEIMMIDTGVDVGVKYTNQNALNKRNIPLYLYHCSINSGSTVLELYNKEYYNTDIKEISYIIESYEAFKKYYKVLDYNDMLLQLIKDIKEDRIELPEIDTVFLDEAQDLTKLQWELFFEIFKNTKNIYIAGDDDQSIYTWAGVDVNNFLNLKYDTKKVLNKSHRLPSNILNYSRNIIKNVSKRFEKEFSPNNEGGEIERILSLKELDLTNDETWLILVRNKCYSEQIIEELVARGVPFSCFKRNFIKRSEVHAIYLWESFVRKNKRLKEKDREKLLEYVDEGAFRSKEEWFKAFVHLDEYRKSYYRELLYNKVKLFYIKEGVFKLYKNKIEVTTIHRAKGREADNVVILPNQTYTTSKMGRIYPDSEHRVFYVATTRAKKRLFLLEPNNINYYKGVFNNG